MGQPLPPDAQQGEGQQTQDGGQAGDPQAGQQTHQEEPLGEPGKRALQAERDARKAAEKAAADALAKAKEYEDRDKTELQRAQDAAAEADRRAIEAWRQALTQAHQISEEDAETFLTGGDAQTLQRQAARLVELRGQTPQQPPAPTPQTPVEHLRPGAMATPPEPTTTERIRDAEQRGDWKAAQAMKTSQLLDLNKQQK